MNIHMEIEIFWEKVPHCTTGKARPEFQRSASTYAYIHKTLNILMCTIGKALNFTDLHPRIHIQVRHMNMYEDTHGKQPSIDFTRVTARPKVHRSASTYKYIHKT